MMDYSKSILTSYITDQGKYTNGKTKKLSSYFPNFLLLWSTTLIINSHTLQMFYQVILSTIYIYDICYMPLLQHLPGFQREQNDFVSLERKGLSALLQQPVKILLSQDCWISMFTINKVLRIKVREREGEFAQLHWKCLWIQGLLRKSFFLEYWFVWPTFISFSLTQILKKEVEVKKEPKKERLRLCFSFMSNWGLGFFFFFRGQSAYYLSNFSQ